MMRKEVLLEVKDMHKHFGSTIALNGVDFTVYRGEVRGLVGENGSGKSTITSIVAGMQNPTSGKMFYQGKSWHPMSMLDAQRQGISMILQESNTIPGVTVAQNLFAGQEELFSKAGFINLKKMYRAADELLDKFGINHIRGRDNIDLYTFEDRKLIEIIRAMKSDIELLIVDETTTALSFEGRELLYRLIREMANNNKAVIFISHDMDEILSQCTALTVLRDGNITGIFSEEEISGANNEQLRKDLEKSIRYKMVGREIGDKYYRDDYDYSCQPEVALHIDNVSLGEIRGFSLALHKGEIVGIGGLSNCGMHEVGRIAFGVERPNSGKVMRNGVEIKNSVMAVQEGIGYISKNRDQEALILQGSIGENIVFPSLRDLQQRTFISPRAEKKLATTEIKEYRIKSVNERQWVNTLSGGNKQKVSFAKWTAKNSDVLIMDCPTRGVDIGVKQAMYQIIAEMKKQGKAIMIISEELTELIGMSDRLIIMKDFAVQHTFVRSPDLKETSIIEYMI